MISVYGDLKGENYKTFVSFAMEHSDAMMLIYCGYGYPLKRRIRDIRRMLRPFRVASRDNSKSLKKGKPEFEWPNTISRTKALICAETYRLSPEVKEIVLSVDDIFAWNYRTVRRIFRSSIRANAGLPQRRTRNSAISATTSGKWRRC